MKSYIMCAATYGGLKMDGVVKKVESFAERVQAEIKPLEPRIKRQAISALEQTIQSAERFLSIRSGRGGYLVIANLAGIPLSVHLEGRFPNARESREAMNDALGMASSMGVFSEKKEKNVRGAVVGKKHIIVFAGLGEELDEAVALLVALDLDELRRDEVKEIASLQPKNESFFKIFNSLNAEDTDV